jgi:hypothetical protein
LLDATSPTGEPVSDTPLSAACRLPVALLFLIGL